MLVSLVLCGVVVRFDVWSSGPLHSAAFPPLCPVVLLCSPPPLLLPLMLGFALRPVVLCRVLLCVWCCAALCRRACIVLFSAGLVCAVSGASCCGALLCAVLFPLTWCGAVVLPYCVMRCLVVPCCPCAVCCGDVLPCGAVLLGSAVLFPLLLVASSLFP